MTPKPLAPSFTRNFFLRKHGLICRTASATLCLVCLHCMRSSLLLAVCVCLGKHVLGIASNPSRGVTLKCFSPGALQRCGIRWKGSTSCLCGQVPGRGGQSLNWPPVVLSIQPLGDTTCSTTAPDGATLGTVEGWVLVLVCIMCL